MYMYITDNLFLVQSNIYAMVGKKNQLTGAIFFCLPHFYRISSPNMTRKLLERQPLSHCQTYTALPSNY